ncbi:hypothetical protein LCGC14_0514290 [marine sediment metagenome]|uniref:Uncharacterized protein n=1 Tax=marine sediment metagenome TaxID=412755 RepID=A0A0F9S070_9ZZZZ
MEQKLRDKGMRIPEPCSRCECGRSLNYPKKLEGMVVVCRCGKVYPLRFIK